MKLHRMESLKWLKFKVHRLSDFAKGKMTKFFTLEKLSMKVFYGIKKLVSIWKPQTLNSIYTQTMQLFKGPFSLISNLRLQLLLVPPPEIPQEHPQF